VDKQDESGEKFYIQNNQQGYISSLPLLKRVILCRIDKQCQKEHFNHTHDTAQKRTAFALELQLNQVATLSRVAASRAALD